MTGERDLGSLSYKPSLQWLPSCSRDRTRNAKGTFSRLSPVSFVRATWGPENSSERMWIPLHRRPPWILLHSLWCVLCSPVSSHLSSLLTVLAKFFLLASSRVCPQYSKCPCAILDFCLVGCPTASSLCWVEEKLLICRLSSIYVYYKEGSDVFPGFYTLNGSWKHFLFFIGAWIYHS